MGWIKKKFKIKIGKSKFAKKNEDGAQVSDGVNKSSAISQPGLNPAQVGNVLETAQQSAPLEPSDATSDNFSFANFNWLGYMAHRSAPDSQTLESMEAEMDNGKGDLKYVWYPFELPMEDGSRTIAFKLTKRDASKLKDALSDPNASNQSDKVQALLFRNAQEVITTPSKSDIMRGTRPNVLVVRTPASFIDLMDDQVPDLREGFFVDPPDSDELSPFRGGPLENLGVGAGFSVAQKICEILGDYVGADISAEKVWNIVKRVLLNGFTPLTVFRLWKGILGGDLLNYVKAHPDKDVYDAITDWFAEWFAGDDIVSQVKQHADDTTEITPTPGGEYQFRWDDLQNLFPSSSATNESSSSSSDDNLLNSRDFDIAYVPVSFWKRLYSMGSNFSRRNRIPNFSSLVLSGSPTSDLWLNRVPHIYIEDNGLPSLRYWEYAGVPLAGGLFKKIKNAVKKVGQVAKKVAKGVSKVMDGPLGGVISAIPVVGNIASVAGKVANGITKVTDKIDSMKSRFLPESEEESSMAYNDNNGDSDAGPESAGNLHGVVRGAQSDVLLNTDPSGRAIDVAALPTWSAPIDDPYIAPPLALLASDPKLLTTYRPLMFPASRVPSDREAMAMDACGRLAFLRKAGRLMSVRGPQLMMSVTNTSVVRPQTGKWKRSIDSIRTSPIPLLAGGDVERELIAAALRGFGPMSEWSNMTSLNSESSTVNPFASTFFYLAASPGTKSLFTGTASGSEDYVFHIPSLQIISKKGLKTKEVCLASIVWANVLVSASALNSQQQSEIVKAMQPVAIAGAWTGKSVDPLLSLVVKGEWPSSSDARNGTLMKNWTRMLASAILFIWADAGGANTNSFSQAIAQVMTPSVDAIHNMLVDFGADANESRKSDDPESTATASLEASARTTPKGGNTTGAGAALNDVLASLQLQDPENNLLEPSSHEDLGFKSTTNLESFSREADSYFAIASRICRESPSSRIAILRMNAARIPSFITTMALRQYYPDYTIQDAADTPMTAIPYSRSDFMTFGREGL